MRVIAGKARSIPLKAPKGEGTRPTTDRIKETLFNIIRDLIPGCRFLDLFAGSGAIGIEALSRDAASCVFVEKDRQAASVIKENLHKTKLERDGQVLVTDVLSAIRRLEHEPPFQCVFIDPPYHAGVENQVLGALAKSSIINDDSLIILEAALGDSLPYAKELPFICSREKRYKTNRHLFLRRQPI